MAFTVIPAHRSPISKIFISILIEIVFIGSDVSRRIQSYEKRGISLDFKNKVHFNETKNNNDAWD